MKRKSSFSQVRIIGGVWRSRKIQFLENPSLRPTPDRVRETLFNWLSPIIVGAHGLDLFAGSGALGFEALSRGAATVTLIDESFEAVQQLRKTQAALDATQALIIQARIPHVTLTPAHPIDIVFLDPPFHQNLITTTLAWLEKQPWLSPQATLYLEVESSLQPLPLPPNWQILREQRAGKVVYCLVRRG